MIIVSVVFFFPYMSAKNTFQCLVLPPCYAKCDTVCTVQRFWLQVYSKVLRKSPSSIQTKLWADYFRFFFPCPTGFITRDSSLLTLPSDLENHIPPLQLDLSSVKNNVFGMLVLLMSTGTQIPFSFFHRESWAKEFNTHSLQSEVAAQSSHLSLAYSQNSRCTCPVQYFSQ